MKKPKLLVLNGPNLNMLGIREPEIYGHSSYRSLTAFIKRRCAEKGMSVRIVQSNHEGELVTRIQRALGSFDAIIINPAAYTHTSVAILDALKAVSLPSVEVHLSQVDKREDFRRRSYVSMACEVTFSGEGFESYGHAIDYLHDRLLK